MTVPIERARSRRPVTWLTIIGVILLPVVIGGILVAALYNPVDRLEHMSAAIVNEDEPVTIDDQLVPLGRQLTAGLVEGSDDASSNLDWTISNADDAAAGLADGTYAAVVTIPEDFSAAATSTRDGDTATQATIDVQTAPDALVVDDAITATITRTAASVLGQEVSKTYLENVFVGFTTLGDRLGDAADGAAQLASGAHSAAEGAAQLPGGATQLASGASGLASGLTTIAGRTRDAGAGAADLAAGITQLSGQMTSTAEGTLGGTAAAATSYAGQAAASTKSLATNYQTLLAQNNCIPPATPLTPEQAAVCQALGSLSGDVTASATNAGYAAGYAAGVQTGLGEAAGGANQLAGGANSLTSGLGQLASGIDQSATGATQLGDGATQLATGAQGLVDGVGQLAAGTDDLASGLRQASESVPVYDDDGAKNLATVLSDPVQTTGLGTNLFGASAIPLLAMLALWLGGLGSYIALQAVTRHALTSRRPSALLALRSLWPAAAMGAVQGILVAGVVQVVASYEGGTWWAFAGLCVLAGVAFAAVNQSLVAVFGGAGRWIAALIGVLAVATGIVSTVPGVLSAIAGVMPTAPAYHAMVGVLAASGGVGAGVVGLLVWAGLAFIATTLAVARRRTISARALLAAPVIA